MTTTADQIVQQLRAAGVRRLFGMPGGGSIADLIEAAGRIDLPFSLAHTETGAAFMASAQAEITGQPGACLATLGPGAMTVMNGVANAWLDRIPLLVITDCHDEPAALVMQHQTLDQSAMFSLVTKVSLRLRAGEAARQVQHAATIAAGPPPGPVHLDCAAETTGSPAASSPAHAQHTEVSAPPSGPLAAVAQSLLRQARYPLLLVGLGARSAGVAVAVRALCERHGIPALVTYKAKGVVADTHPWFAGVLTHGALERPVLEQADLLIGVGLDPVELLARPWSYPQPVISLTGWPMNQRHLPLAAEWTGDLAQLVAQVSAGLPAQAMWDGATIRRHVAAQRAALRPRGEAGRLWPHRLVELVAEAYPESRVTVDAGAHMFAAMALWPVGEPGGLLISNGLATMGYALPAAIGAALLDPSKPTVALTGDGGLLMCLGELRTAARERLPLRVVVFDDSALSLIKIKQIQRSYRTAGVTIGDLDWPALGEALGLLSRRATTEQELERGLRDTADYAGPVLIAATIDAQTYQPIMRVLRG